MKAIPVDESYLGGCEPILGQDYVVCRAPRFSYRSEFPLWHRSSSVTFRIVSVDPVLAQPVKLTRSWKNIVSGEFMMHERAL